MIIDELFEDVTETRTALSQIERKTKMNELYEKVMEKRTALSQIEHETRKG